jgi:hypothetical protein
MATRKISVREADAMAGDAWFEGYTTDVVVHDDPVVLSEFDAEARARESGQAEMILFAGGLTVNGPMSLGSDVHSIYVVLGDLHVGSLELGDAVLVVTGRVTAARYLFCARHEGVFRVGPEVELPDDAPLSASDEPPALLDAPIVVWFNRGSREFTVLVRAADGAVASRPDLLLHADLVDLDEFSARRARTALRAGRFPT